MACRSPMARLAILIPDMRGGGAERVALTLVEGFLDRGHEVDLILLRARGELLELLPPGVRIVDLKANRIRQAMGPLARYLRDHCPAGLVAMMWPMPVVAVISRILARSKTRLVASDHAILSEHYRNAPSKLAALRLTTKFFYPFADRRVAASAGIADDLAEISGLRRDRVEVIANPIGMPPDQIQVESKIEGFWGKSGGRILSVGSLKPEKNHELLLNAFALLARRREASLIILGEGEQRAGLEALVRQLGIADRVALPGFRTDPWPFYASADLFVLSSATEGFGNVLVEAMAVGVPVVSTDCAGPREILCDGQFGRLVPLGDVEAFCQSMLEQLASEPDRDRLKQRAQEFRPQSAVDAYLSALIGDQCWSPAP